MKTGKELRENLTELYNELRIMQKENRLNELDIQAYKSLNAMTSNMVKSATSEHERQKLTGKIKKIDLLDG